MTVQNVKTDHTSSAAGAGAITPSDSTTLVGVRGIYVGVTGNVAVTMIDDSTATFVAVPAGTILPIKALKVMSTNTTASSIVALY